MALSGNKVHDEASYYDPQKARQAVEQELVQTLSPNTPLFRSLTDEWMVQFVNNGIDFDTFLETTALPGADKVRDSINKKKEAQMEQMQQQQGNPDEIQQLIDQLQQQGGDASQANPQSMEMLKQYMSQA